MQNFLSFAIRIMTNKCVIRLVLIYESGETLGGFAERTWKFNLDEDRLTNGILLLEKLCKSWNCKIYGCENDAYTNEILKKFLVGKYTMLRTDAELP